MACVQVSIEKRTVVGDEPKKIFQISRRIRGKTTRQTQVTDRNIIDMSIDLGREFNLLRYMFIATIHRVWALTYYVRSFVSPKTRKTK